MPSSLIRSTSWSSELARARRSTNNERRRTRQLTAIAQDPSVHDRRGVLTVELDVPFERLAPGPKGARVHVIDFDASTNTLYKPRAIGLDDDPYRGVQDADQLLGDPAFHAQNVYAIVMATLSRFEYALGRRAPFAFPAAGLRPGAAPGRGHLIKVAPHAFCDANAFYSRRDEALFLGYFPIDRQRKVFTCLSHDVVVHETTHALLDGLRPRYTDPSSPDQAAFHEGFADVVALLSVFKSPKVVELALGGDGRRVATGKLDAESLGRSTLLGLAEEMGSAGRQLAAVRGDALRRSVELEPDPEVLQSAEFAEPHRRGEVFVAAAMRAFLEVWLRRLEPLIRERRQVDVGRVAEEGAAAASHLLTMIVRAIDYAPPVDLHFSDFLTALLTADREIYPDDTKYNYRESLLEAFAKYGIDPVSHGNWEGPPDVSLERNHFDSLQREPDEIAHFLWENREVLELHPHAYTYVCSVRPCVRVDNDGFTQRETIAEYVQILDTQARELGPLRIRKPDAMPNDTRVVLYGGGVLVFDEFGRLKYHVGSGVGSRRQSARLSYLWESGFYGERQGLRRVAELHRARVLTAPSLGKRWS
jgi:hypothetical protein